MKKSNVYFFRVGMDTTRKIKCPKKGIVFPLGYVFTKEENDFVYIPLLKYLPLNDSKREQLTADFKIGNKTIRKYICSLNELNNLGVHYDPCFNLNGEYSYGDNSHRERENKLYSISKAINLTKLKKGDLLIFCATLKEFNDKKELKLAESMKDFVKLQNNKKSKLYVIGYFIIKEKPTIYNLEKDSKHQFIEEKIKSSFQNNAHIKEGELDYDCSKEKLILVKGNKNSRLLKKAIKIAFSENHGYTIDKESKFRQFIGVNKKGKYHYSYHFYKLVNLNSHKQKELLNYLNKG